jgi:hypothetical protein
MFSTSITPLKLSNAIEELLYSDLEPILKVKDDHYKDLIRYVYRSDTAQVQT